AIDQARLFEDSRELALAQERGRLARELHDALAQTLLSLRLAAETAASLPAEDPDGAAAQVEVVRRLAGQAAGELRMIMDGVRPAARRRDGLAAAGRCPALLAAGAHGVESDVEVGELPELDPDVEHQVLRIAQEAVTNALRHAAADRVVLRLGPHDRRPDERV